MHALLLTLLFAAPPKPGDKEFDPFADYNLASKKVDPPAPTSKEPETAKLIKFDVKVEPTTAKRGEILKLTIEGKPTEGHYTYPLTMRSPKQLPAQLPKLTFEKSDVFRTVGTPEETEAVFANAAGDIILEHKKPFTWTQKILVDPKAAPGKSDLAFSVRLQVCDESRCTWGTHEFRLPVTILEESVSVPSEVTAQLDRKFEVTVKQPPSDVNPDGSKKTDDGLLSFIMQGIFWGAVSLVTPCVFPMIPITVSFFLKQSEKEGHRPFLMASVYCSTIVIVLTIAAVALLSFFRAVSTHYAMNFGLGALFIFFALSLFGMYDIELPSGLANFTSTREGSSLLGTMFMALTFTIISFACVAPFLGGFGGTAANANLGFGKILLGGLAFSITFASPFMVLALFPALLKKMPKSGTWLNSVKVVMGFLELAAALKFFRQGELLITVKTVFFTYDFVMGLYIAICVLTALYLLGTYRLPHDTPLENLGVIRMLMALCFFGLAVYLLPAMWKTNDKGTTQRPKGAIFAWLDSFLLPEHVKDLPWIGNLDDGLKLAQTQGRRVFIDFTGKTCTNCKINEREVFTQPEVRELLLQYVLVAQYTDLVPDDLYPDKVRATFKGSTDQQEKDAKLNLEFQRKVFETEQLPLYVIVQPDGKGGFTTVAVYKEGKINNLDAFMSFLRDNVLVSGN